MGTDWIGALAGAGELINEYPTMPMSDATVNRAI